MDEINGSFGAVRNAEGRVERGYLFLKLKFPSSDCARARKKNTLCISEFLENVAYFETDEVYNRIADNY